MPVVTGDGDALWVGILEVNIIATLGSLLNGVREREGYCEGTTLLKPYIAFYIPRSS